MLKGIIAYYTINDMALEVFKDDQDILSEMNDVLLPFILISVFFAFGIALGRSILRFRKWAVTALQLMLLLFSLGIIVFIAMTYVEMIREEDEFSYLLKKSALLSYGLSGLVISWIFTRVNLMLLKKEYRQELV